MLINKDIAISTSKILLVPYEDHHVHTYNSWMQNEDLQEATASEPLTLDQEFAMQRSWRADADKLTFIACLPLRAPSAAGPKASMVVAGEDDAPRRMVGDINLFLTRADEDPEGCIGEMELMIAPEEERRKGYGRAAVVAFLMYLERHLGGVLAEYGGSVVREAGGEDGDGGGGREGRMRLLQLRVKIGSKNKKSISLFKSVGFVKVGEGENYFGEVEMVLEGFLEKGRIEGQFKKWGMLDYEEMRYSRRVDDV